jgi:uncharacterized membrane protein
MSARWYSLSAAIVAGLGFIDATFLTIQHYTNFTLPCSITHGCELVTTSAYSSILGVPVALLGALYYVGVLFAIYLSFEFAKAQWLKWIAIASTAGFLFSLWFVYLQLFVIHAICQYCMLSALTSTTLFVLSMVYLKKLVASSK